MSTNWPGEDSDFWKTAKASGEQLMDECQYDAAIVTLEKAAHGDHSGESHALLGLACYHSEDYVKASKWFEEACQRNPESKNWRLLRDYAKSNAISEVHIRIPEYYLFDRQRLLAPPSISDSILPKPRPPLQPPRLLTRIQSASGSVLGTISSLLMTSVTHCFGAFFGYRGEVWTNWYKRKRCLGVLTLAYMRERLNKNNLYNTYPKGVLTGFLDKGMTPPEGVTHFRTADGSWNNLNNPKEGAAGTRFPRNVANGAICAETGDVLLTPSPREISRKLLTRERPMKEVPFLNLLAAAWIQFENHDWVNHGEILSNDRHEIRLTEDDPLSKRYRQTKLYVGKSQPDPTHSDGEPTPTTFINEVTHWWDGSQIYGSDQETVTRLRSGVDGKLKVSSNGTLPIAKNGIEDTGFVRNWWLGLSLMHTLFAQEHNAICDRLKLRYPTWDDNRLFNVSRLINAAVMAKIHTVEWTPAILPNHVLSLGLNANWYGLLTNIFRSDRHRKTLAGINVANPELGGGPWQPNQ